MDYRQFDTKGLNILYELQENLCLDLTKKIEDETDKESEEHQRNISQLSYLLHEMESISKELEIRRNSELTYSIEDIYKTVGQFDKYVIFHFYRTTDAYKKYGDEAFGHLIYKKDERESLEKIIKNDKYERNDGVILLDAACKNEEIAGKLKENGFHASEVFEILTMKHEANEKAYKKDGEKTIPNTITIPFDSSDYDLERMQIYLVSSKLKNGFVLLEHELFEYYCNLFVISPESVTKENKERYLYKEDKKTLSEEAQLKINLIKYRRRLLEQEEKDNLNNQLKTRRKSRFNIIKKELGISNKQLEEFREKHPDRYDELYGVALTFETETLSEYKTKYPIYWDFERFLHIYVRHYKNFFIESSTYKGTHFQYNYKDIRRVACLVIESLKNEIESSLSQGEPYAKYGDQGYYFNGNFYNLRIDKDGRLMQFHSLEVK